MRVSCADAPAPQKVPGTFLEPSRTFQEASWKVQEASWKPQGDNAAVPPGRASAWVTKVMHAK